MRELKLKNDEDLSKFDQAMEKARANLYKSIEIYGLSSNEVIIASRNLDIYINMSMKKEQLNINNK
jgi:hypothetical protein